MCGIYLALSRHKYVQPSDGIVRLLQNRGPDSVRQWKFKTPDGVFVAGVSTVLSLRGQETVSQPVTDSQTIQDHSCASFLCWNGEAWTFAGTALRGNDSQHVFRVLSHASRSIFSSVHDAHALAVSEALSNFAGPYAFAYFDGTQERLFFGRDCLGRRSLLSHQTEDGDLIISSVPEPHVPGWAEVEADGVYWVDLKAFGNSMQPLVRSTPYHYGLDTEAADARRVSYFTFRGPWLGLLILAQALQPFVLNRHVTSQSADEATLSDNSPSVTTLERLLRQSIYARVYDIPRRTLMAKDDVPEASTKLAILFSGGLDCTVLARLAHDILDPQESIDLLNVAFENPRVHKRSNDGANWSSKSPYELCPDRVTGRSSLSELQLTCPGRIWRFVAINVPYTETLAHRDTVTTLMHPHNTEMDLSIACALYFAARGSGLVTLPEGDTTPYTATARVLLSGLGADELFAGYTRHGTAFHRKGHDGLLEELELDIGRLGKRNLGRDDRVISTWAREARFPFLDERLVNWALRTPASDKCGFGEPADAAELFDGSTMLDPSKKVLRCLAWKLGMFKVANEKKRAVTTLHFWLLFFH